MNYQKYLDRMQSPEISRLDIEGLTALQKNHLLYIPFENLDIHYGNSIQLDIERIYNKIVEKRRGGFCYELNGLFYQLLTHLGFNAKMVSAKVYDSKINGYKQEFGHLALVVEMDGIRYLLDVGFGEFTLYPLQIDIEVIQNDPRGQFKVERMNEADYHVLKLVENAFQPCYIFSITARNLEDFTEMCHYQQTSPNSSFTQKRVISKPIENGRITITNNILKITGQEHVLREETIESETAFFECLEKHFGITVAQIEACR